MRRNVTLSIAVFLGLLLAVRLWAQPPGKNTSRLFQGYWMGVDPLDGGDSRRGLMRQQNGAFALAGRDTFFTLCDNTDRGFISFEDGVVAGRDTMRTDNLKITCLNTGAIVLLKARYVLIDDSTMVEVVTAQDSTPVDTIIFHKISQQ
jgi:hypothetical protein